MITINQLRWALGWAAGDDVAQQFENEFFEISRSDSALAAIIEGLEDALERGVE